MSQRGYNSSLPDRTSAVHGCLASTVKAWSEFAGATRNRLTFSAEVSLRALDYLCKAGWRGEPDKDDDAFASGVRHDIKGNVSRRPQPRASSTTPLTRIRRRSRGCGFSFLCGPL